MNRIVLIGNGFDLAHGLPTRYQDFIDWYWEQRVHSLGQVDGPILEDPLCTFELKTEHRSSWRGWCNTEVWAHRPQTMDEFWQLFNSYPVCKLKKSAFFENICKSIETKNWVDIENEYYELLKEYTLHSDGSRDSLLSVQHLNMQLQYLEHLLVDYLSTITITTDIKIEQIGKHIYESIKKDDISVMSQGEYKKHVDSWLTADELTLDDKLEQCEVNRTFRYPFVEANKAKKAGNEKEVDYRLNEYDYDTLAMPDRILLLSFNYTDTARLYLKQHPAFECQYIHGTLDNPESVIFGYGDELDEKYKEIRDKNENTYLRNIKSIRYLESDNYRKMLQFIDSAPFQIFIMGHSCGNSDRTLLNTLFEHKNCISIKPFYYTWTEKDEDGTEHVKDNYLELVQNISRNFTDMKLMRDRVVNKTYCKEIKK